MLPPAGGGLSCREGVFLVPPACIATAEPSSGLTAAKPNLRRGKGRQKHDHGLRLIMSLSCSSGTAAHCERAGVNSNAHDAGSWSKV